MISATKNFGDYSVSYKADPRYLNVKVTEPLTNTVISSQTGKTANSVLVTNKVSSDISSHIDLKTNNILSIKSTIDESTFRLNSGSLSSNEASQLSNSLLSQNNSLLTLNNQVNNLKSAQSFVVTDVTDAALSQLSTNSLFQSKEAEQAVNSLNLTGRTNLAGSFDQSVTSQFASKSDTLRVSPAILTSTPQAAIAKWESAADLRAKLRVPNEYISPGTPSAGPDNIIFNNGGILFPYTPTVTYTNSANYADQSPTHSNYKQYFFKNSEVASMSVTGKFTVQNEKEGFILLATLHLLRALTKMRFGNDSLAGSPPPVCRFDAFGDSMIYNVPVAVTRWSHEIPEGVDFITIGKSNNINLYGTSLVPTISTISLDLAPMYSRQEMLDFNIPDWLAGNLKFRGYL